MPLPEGGMRAGGKHDMADRLLRSGRCPSCVVRGVSIVLIALVAAACTVSAGAPRPSAAFRPELVAVNPDVDAIGCGVSRVVTTSGERIELAMVWSSYSLETPCPDTTVPRAWRAFGDNASDTAREHLFFYGHDPTGMPWYGWAQSDVEACPDGGFVLRAGSYYGGWEDIDIVHLSMGLVLEKTRAFAHLAPDASPRPFNRALCVNEAGRVVALAERAG